MININNIEPSSGSYSIDALSEVPEKTENIIGEVTTSFRFYFVATFHEDTVNEAIENNEFMESVSGWVKAQNEESNFPTATGKKITVENNPEILSKDPSNSIAIYQILVNYKYKEE
jgi:hypothetical protein